MLDCIEDILSEERVNTLRIDGSTPIVVSWSKWLTYNDDVSIDPNLHVQLRQDIIDKFNNQKKWNVVLVSAKVNFITDINVEIEVSTNSTMVNRLLPWVSICFQLTELSCSIWTGIHGRV
jgi:hypothetical protein